MNKLKVTIAGLLIACFGIIAVNAQDKTAAPVKQTPAKKSTKKASTAKTGTETKTMPKPVDAKTPATPTQHLKKDGTPDKRYKENKTAPAAKPAPKKAAATNKAM